MHPLPQPQDSVTAGSSDPGANNEAQSDAIQKVEVVGQPKGWAAMADVVRAYDEDRVKDSKEDIDTLMVFVRVYLSCVVFLSAVLTLLAWFLNRLVFSPQW